MEKNKQGLHLVEPPISKLNVNKEPFKVLFADHFINNSIDNSQQYNSLINETFQITVR